MEIADRIIIENAEEDETEYLKKDPILAKRIEEIESGNAQLISFTPEEFKTKKKELLKAKKPA